MADDGNTGSESSHNVDYHSLFSNEVGEILVKLDSQAQSEVVDELVERLDAEILKDTRLKVFCYAKNKIVDAVTAPRTMEIDPAFDGNVSYGDSDKAQQIVDEWSLIARKGLPRIALDIVEFLRFYGDDNAYFPYKLIKRKKPTRKGRKGIKKRNVRDSRQTTLSFTPKDKTTCPGSDIDIGRGSRFEKDRADSLDNEAVDGPSSAEGDTQSDESESELSDISEGDKSSDNIDSHEFISRDDTVYIPPSGRVSTLTPAASYTRDPVEDKATDPPGSAEHHNNVQPKPPLEPIEPERRKQAATNENRRQGALTTHALSLEASEPARPSAEISTQPQTTVAHTSKPVVTIIRAQPSERGFWEPQQSTNYITGDTAITMATQTEWDLWGSPAYTDGRSLAPSRHVSECDCKYNVKVLNEWRREADRRSVVNDENYKAKLNFLRAKIIEGEEDRGKMRDTIAALTKQVAANTASAAEAKLRASDLSNSQPQQPPRGLGSVSQSAAASNRGNTPLPQRPPNVTTRQRSNNSAKGVPQTNFGNATLRDTPGPSGANAGLDMYTTTNVPSNTNIAYRTQNGVTTRGGGAPPNASSRPEGPRSNPVPSRNTQTRVDTSTHTNPRDPIPPSTRPKSVLVSRTRNDPRASVDLPLNGDLSFSWSEDPVSDFEIVASEAPAPRNPASAPVQKDRASVVHQNRYDILRDAFTDTIQREEAAKKADGFGENRDIPPKAGEKRDISDDVDPDCERESYVGVAGKFDWESENKRRKRGNSGEHVPPIYGVKTTPQRDIFVRDLAYSMCSSPEDMEQRVKNHCRLRGVVISFVKAFPIKSNCAKANCKITVNLEDVSNVLSDTFWPQYVSARMWRLNPPNNAGNEGSDNRGPELCVGNISTRWPIHP